MRNWDSIKNNKGISKAVIANKTTSELERCAKFINELLELKKSEKLYTTYIKGTRKAIENNEEDKVYVKLNLDGTTTGRLSCAAWDAKEAGKMGVSFHTLPRSTPKVNIRSFFNAPDGWAFGAADYSQMELRILSHVAKEKTMQKAFLDGVDLHTYTAQLIYDTEKITKEQRQIAKTVSFLIVYGGGAFNLANEVKISMKKAEGILTRYKRVYPGVFEYMEFVEDFVKTNGYTYTIMGRRRHLPDVFSKDRRIVQRAVRQGLNFTVQSPASDILMCALIKVYYTIKELELKSRLVCTVHDSIEYVSPWREVEFISGMLYDEMINCHYMVDKFGFKLDVPMEVDMEIGSSFGINTPLEFVQGEPQNMQAIRDIYCE